VSTTVAVVPSGPVASRSLRSHRAVIQPECVAAMTAAEASLGPDGLVSRVNAKHSGRLQQFVDHGDNNNRYH
jgi:hypothetical protein